MKKKNKIKMIKNQIKFRKFINKKWGSVYPKSEILELEQELKKLLNT
jgi:hypothetical protein